MNQLRTDDESLPVLLQVKVSFGFGTGRFYHWKQTSKTSKLCTLVPLSVFFLFPAILWQNSSVFLQRQSVLYTGLHKSPLQIARTALHAKQEARSPPCMGGAPGYISPPPRLATALSAVMVLWSTCEHTPIDGGPIFVVYSRGIWFCPFPQSTAELLLSARERDARRGRSQSQQPSTTTTCYNQKASQSMAHLVPAEDSKNSCSLLPEQLELLSGILKWLHLSGCDSVGRAERPAVVDWMSAPSVHMLNCPWSRPWTLQPPISV